MLRNASILAGILLAAFVCQGIADDANADPYGKWILRKADGTGYRMKDVQKDKEILSVFDLKGELVYQHSVSCKISELDDLSVFTFWGGEILVDTSKTDEEIAETNKTWKEQLSEPIKYVFKIEGNKWVEVHHLWGGAENNAYLATFTRVADEADLPWKKPEGELPKEMKPKVVMNYFVGNWELLGKVGEIEYKGRFNLEWTLHHNAMVGNAEFFGPQGDGGSLHTLWGWDNVTARIIDRHTTSWGAHRDISLKIVPEGDSFKLVGVGVETTDNDKSVSDIEVTIVDQNHYTWRIIPRDKSKPEGVEECYRITSLPE